MERDVVAFVFFLYKGKKSYKYFLYGLHPYTELIKIASGFYKLQFISVIIL